jgi:hypothetical protein
VKTLDTLDENNLCSNPLSLKTRLDNPPLPPWEQSHLECVNNIGEMSWYGLAISFQLHMANVYHDFLHICTDGSKTGHDTPVRAAFVIPKLQITNHFELPTETSVFQAEIIAIKKAFEYIGTNLEGSGVNSEKFWGGGARFLPPHGRKFANFHVYFVRKYKTMLIIFC